jgi:hypothetical protein
MTVERTGMWMQSFTGRKIYVTDPRPEDVCIEDIAHALSLICRFGGHAREHYSVAQHSVLVSALCSKEHFFMALLHDASETYVGDMVRPLKRQMPEFSALEVKWHAAIGERFGVSLHPEPQGMSRIHEAVLATERRDVLVPGPTHDWGLTEEALKFTRIVPWAADVSEQAFLARFKELEKTR